MRRGTHAVHRVLGFVLLAMVLIVIIALFTSLRGLWDHATQDSECRTQIRAHSAAVRYTADQKAPTIVCPSKRMDVPLGEEKDAIASEMHRCWDMWGRGRLPLFGKSINDTYCHVCSLLSLSQDVKGLPAYLDTAKTKEGVTYAQFLTGTTSGEYFSDASFPEQAEQTISADAPLGIIFVHAKGQNGMDRLQNFVLGSPASAPYRGMAVGVAVGVGTVAAAPVSVPFLVASGVVVGAGAAGGTGGFIASLALRERADSLSVIVARPLTEGDIERLKCTYAPVADS